MSPALALRERCRVAVSDDDQQPGFCIAARPPFKSTEGS
jgi:hypothetical protein